jgi:hypothetical protein
MKKVIRLTESDLVRIVKRIINEQDNKVQDDTLNQIMSQVANILNTQIDAKIKVDPKFPTTKLTVERRAVPNDARYGFKYGNTQVGESHAVTTMLTSNGPEVIGNSIVQTFNVNYNPSLPKTLQLLPQPGLQKAVSAWIASYKPKQIKQ